MTVLLLLGCFAIELAVPERMHQIFYLAPFTTGVTTMAPQLGLGIAELYQTHGLQGLIVLIMLCFGIFSFLALLSLVKDSEKVMLLENAFAATIGFATGVGYKTIIHRPSAGRDKPNGTRAQNGQAQQSSKDRQATHRKDTEGHADERN